MFSFGSGKSPYPNVYTMTTVKKVSNKKDGPPSPLRGPSSSSAESLQPAIDGPPSPERIRAYTEAMKRSSIFGNNSRSNTLSSTTPSFRSRDSSSPSTDGASLSRKSSHRSTSSGMPSTRSERPDSVLGALFSRSGRKSRRENIAGGLRVSASSINISDSVIDEANARDRGKRSHSHRRHNISEPYNFTHITHTRQDHLPNLEQTSRMDLVSEFSAIRASQAPTNGELKGIRAQDLHFENFSSEALSLPYEESIVPSPRSPRQQNLIRKSPAPPRMRSNTKSHDNLRAGAPPRPPRSPLSPVCPIALPARTSSRTASVLFDKFDPLATTTIERPHTNGGFRRPAPFNLPVPPPFPTWDEQQGGHLTRPLSHAVTTPGDEAWPLTASPSGTFGAELLADVQEEEEDTTKRFSRTSFELKTSKSVPALRRRSLEKANASTETLARVPSNDTTTTQKAPLAPAFQFSEDSWEEDIDWCYENEVEADCNYEWDHCSEETETVIREVITAAPAPAPAPLELSVQNDERVYYGRFRPSLLVPISPYDLPELSSMSNSSTPTTDPRTPAFLRPQHIRSPSRASSFKESHGFHLSPSLLIPQDFQHQMEEDAIYQDQFLHDNAASATIFIQEPYSHPFPPVDETESSTASYRSSNISRASARDSSSTRISSANSRGSQDSIILLSRAASLSKAHRSIGSASSLPDLIHSMHHQHPSVTEVSSGLSTPNVSVESLQDSAPAPGIAGPAPALASLQHQRNKSLAIEQGLRKLNSSVAVSAPEPAEFNLPLPATVLSPVPESFPELDLDVKIVEPVRPLVHGRKVSAPVVSPSLKEFKGRARSATTAAGKARGSYMLFPQV